MKGIFTKILTVIGALIVLMVISNLLFAFLFWPDKGSIPQKTILEMDFERGLTEIPSDDPLALMLKERTPVVREVIEALEKASTDERVVAFVARVGSGDIGMAQIQEVRDAVLNFRDHGKPAVAFAETFGEFRPGNGAYYLATAFDEIYLQPSGNVGLTGLIAETPFLRGTLDKLGVVPRLDHREEYKTMENLFTERQYTEAHREATRKVMDSLFGQMVRGISQGRKMAEEQVRQLVDQGPFWSQQAVDLKLVDALAYRDEVSDRIKKRVGEDAGFFSLADYFSQVDKASKDAQTIAVIYGVGNILRGKSHADPLFGGVTMGSDTVAKAFRDAIEDDDVKAILFRVDSPGGSYVASDTIWSETLRAKKAGKPVIVSMGNVAGSGGYFVAMGADKIVAQPGTITGSIGVVAGKMLLPDLWDKLGVSWDEVHTSKNAAMWSYNQDYTPEQWNILQDWLDRIYDDFTHKAAMGRRLSKNKILEVAKGRIWSGEDAKANGLVDALGGFPLALRLAKESVGIPADAEVNLERFPKKKPPLQKIIDRLLGREEDEDEAYFSTETLAHTLKALQPLISLARETGLLPQPGVLTMPSSLSEK